MTREHEECPYDSPEVWYIRIALGPVRCSCPHYKALTMYGNSFVSPWAVLYGSSQWDCIVRAHLRAQGSKLHFYNQGRAWITVLYR
jgi:hypothetical protein